MRILVFSDIHGNIFPAEKAITLHPEADAVIFLGDGERDFDRLLPLLDGKKIFSVCGNCDFCSALPDELFEIVGGVKILCMHGHKYNVKYGDGAAVERALKINARILLYGHTHTPVTRYEDGLYIMNPGAAITGCYGIIDITPNGIACINAKV